MSVVQLTVSALAPPKIDAPKLATLQTVCAVPAPTANAAPSPNTEHALATEDEPAAVDCPAAEVARVVLNVPAALPMPTPTAAAEHATATVLTAATAANDPSP
jgi:hypothetical protein